MISNIVRNLPHLPESSSRVKLMTRYMGELLAIIALSGFIYACVSHSHFLSPLALGHVCLQFPIQSLSLGAAAFIGVPLVLASLPKKQQAQWARSKFPCTLRVIGLALRAFSSVCSDVLWVPLAGGLALMAKYGRSNFDPKHPQQGKMPILLIHGHDCNETTWVAGRLALGKQYGSVYTLNYDESVILHDCSKRIAHYAEEKIRPKIQEIQKATQQDRIVLIGHSMGGLIAGYYAETYSDVEVDSVITINTPWQGAPLLNLLERYSAFSHQRFKDMQEKSPFLADLHQKIRENQRKYFTLCSTVDPVVPNENGLIPESEHPERSRVFTYLGHCSTLFWPLTWRQIHQWLKSIYD